MHVLMINQYAVTPDQSGGTRHFTLGRELVRHGHKVTIVASAHHYQGATDSPGTAGVVASEFEGVTFLKVPTLGNQHKTTGRFLAMLDFSRRVLSKATLAHIAPPDIIYGSSPQLFAARAALRLARRLRVPFVLEIRDIWPQTIVELGGVSARNPVVLAMSSIERHLYRNADEIVTLLPHSVDHIGDVGGRRSGITIIPNLVDMDLHTEPEPPPTRDTFDVLYAGAHGLANALGTLIDAAALAQGDKRYSHIRFTLLGAGTEKQRLKERAAQLGLANVAFHDSVPKHEVGAWLARADAFYMPLKASNVFKKGISPNKLFDYMAAARPVIFGVDTPTNPIADCRAGLTIAPENAAALLAAVDELSKLPPDERRQMGLRGRAYVAEHHSPAQMGERLLAVLRRVT